MQHLAGAMHELSLLARHVNGREASRGCLECGNFLRPDVVLFGEVLPLFQS